MITRREFFGTVAALVVGGGTARVRLTAPAAVGLIGGIDRSMFPWWRMHPAQATFFDAPLDRGCTMYGGGRTLVSPSLASLHDLIRRDLELR